MMDREERLREESSSYRLRRDRETSQVAEEGETENIRLPEKFSIYTRVKGHNHTAEKAELVRLLYINL